MNPYSIVADFEESVAKYAGCKYAVAVDNCSNALFLCAKHLRVKHVTIPSRTYPSVPSAIINAGGVVNFENREWRHNRYYRLLPYPIYDAAHMFCENMYNKLDVPLCGGDRELYASSFVCISFSHTKPINIGKGGMILTNDLNAVGWFKKARYCGRNEVPLMQDKIDIIGWNMYMQPEQAARGLLLMNNIDNLRKNEIPDYPDLSMIEAYKCSTS